MRDQTWLALDEFFGKAPILKAECVDLAEIAAAEREVGIPLADDYKEFIHRYGGGQSWGRFVCSGCAKRTQWQETNPRLLK